MAKKVWDIPTPQPELSDGKLIAPGLEAGTPPELARLPSVSDMKGLARTDEGKAILLDLLEQYGVIEPWPVFINRTMDYVSRMTSYPPGSPEWTRAVEQLIGREAGSGKKSGRGQLISKKSGRGLLGMSRQIKQQYSSLMAIDGDVNKEMIWIAEDDVDTCDSCAERAGRMASYAEWQLAGPPGPAVCQGGANCRCDLIVVEG